MRFGASIVQKYQNLRGEDNTPHSKTGLMKYLADL